jgi:hypothetical protein
MAIDHRLLNGAWRVFTTKPFHGNDVRSIKLEHK